MVLLGFLALRWELRRCGYHYVQSESGYWHDAASLVLLELLLRDGCIQVFWIMSC